MRDISPIARSTDQGGPSNLHTAPKANIIYFNPTMAASEFSLEDWCVGIVLTTNVRSTDNMSLSRDEFPPRIDLLKLMAQNPLPLLAPGMVDPVSMADYEPTKQTQLVLDNLNTALARNDAGALEDCFWKDQAYWRDQLALTYHLRTFKSPGIIAASLLETNKLRAIKGDITVDGGAIFIQATPVLVSMTCGDRAG